MIFVFFFFFQAEDGIRDYKVTGVQTCALPISAAQIARMRWKNGSQRKLHRNSPAAGSIASTSTSTSKARSHLIRLTSVRPREINPATSATGATKPHANSVALCGIRREEKLVHFTVQQGRINPGSAAGGTSHCQCSEAGCNSRAEPRT